MIIFLKIAWRNILRNKYRSLITIAAVAIGFASLIFIRAFVDGAHRQMIENYTDLVSSHIQIHKQGFQANMGLQRSIDNPDEISKALAANPRIISFSQRIKEYSLISSAEHSSGILLIGVQPQKEKEISKLYKRIRQGEFISSDNQIVVGKDLARLLNVSLGDKAVVVAQASDGSLASAAYRICGLLDTGAEEIDKGLAIISLNAAQELFVLGNRVSEFAVRADSIDGVEAISASIKNSLAAKGMEVLTWKEISPILLQWVEFDVAFINIILLVVLLVVAAGILNTLLMGILERTREFGIMLALGTKRIQILAMVGLESLILGIIGIFIGYAAGASASLYFGINGINLSAFSTALEDYYTGSIVYTCMSSGYLISYGLVVLLTSLIVSVYPAWRAANLKPVDAIRHM